MYPTTKTFTVERTKGQQTKMDKNSLSYSSKNNTVKEPIDAKDINGNFYFKKGKKIKGIVAQSLQNMNFSSYLNSQKENFENVNSGNALKQFLQKKKEKGGQNHINNNIAKTNVLKTISGTKPPTKVVSSQKTYLLNDCPKEDGNNTGRKNERENLMINTNNFPLGEQHGAKSMQVSPRTFEEAKRLIIGKKEFSREQFERGQGHNPNSNSIDGNALAKAAGLKESFDAAGYGNGKVGTSQ